ncbi:hypothetical protein GCM10009789_66690 [Kribbella sancticallisti]|uniref:Uncharacterized protein n=1 Tax=Kribbella sancticallisti TaxID=460087 RepID=A0ABP4Q8Z4_9ACTN
MSYQHKYLARVRPGGTFRRRRCPEMIAIDREAAEQLIRETRGITGTTDL